MSNSILLNRSCSSICASETPDIVCQKKHDFQALHNSTWNDVKYLSFFSPSNCYNSISLNSSLVGSSCCVRAVSDAGGSAAVQAQPSLSAEKTEGQILGRCGSPGCRAVTTAQVDEALSPLPAFPRSAPAMMRPSNEQGDKCLW